MRILSRFLREGAEFKINNQEGLVGGNGERGSESRIQNHERGLVATEAGKSRESRVQSLDKGVRDFAEKRREFRIQS